MKDLIISTIRSVVPIVVGWAASLVKAHFDIEIEAETLQQLIDSASATGVLMFSAIYYVAVRILEQRFPWLGILLGYPARVTYQKP